MQANWKYVMRLLFLFSLINFFCSSGAAQPVNLNLPEPGEITIGSGSKSQFRFNFPNGESGLLMSSRDGIHIGTDNTTYEFIFPNTNAIRFRSVQRVDDWTVMVLETQSDKCPVNWQIIDMSGSDRNSWAFGNCRDSLQISIHSNHLSMSVGQGENKRMARFVAGYFFTPDPEPVWGNSVIPTSESSESPVKRATPDAAPKPKDLQFDGAGRNTRQPKTIKLD